MKLISHYDLDGAVSAIIAKKKYGKFEAERYQSYSKINENLKLIVNESENNDLLVATDLSLNSEQLNYCQSRFTEFHIYDHHESSISLEGLIKDSNKAFLTQDNCASKIIYDTYNIHTPALDLLVDATNAYDNWRTEDPLFETGKHLNYLFWKYAMPEFQRKFGDGFEKFDAEDKKILDYIETTRDTTIKTKLITEILPNESIAYMKTDENQGSAFDLSSEMTLVYPMYKIYYYIRYHTKTTNYQLYVRVRRNNLKKDINLNQGIEKIGKQYYSHIESCGGHPSAVGAIFRKKITIEEVLDFVYDLNHEYMRLENE